jgi:hypothetical protein
MKNAPPYVGGYMVLVLFLGPTAFLSAAITQSTFTEVVRTVDVLPETGAQARPAQVSDLFKTPERARTGINSRAELTAPDRTLTRIGATSVFYFREDGRSIHLEEGSVLLQAPKGRRGQQITTAGATAGVSGTTIIVAATPNGGFKMVVLEGKGRVSLPNGRSRRLRAGQMIYVLPGQPAFGPVLDINLATLVAGSTLVGGFTRQLPSMPLIERAIKEQQRDMAKGRLADAQIASLSNRAPLDDVATQTGAAPIQVAPFTSDEGAQLFPLGGGQVGFVSSGIQSVMPVVIPAPLGRSGQGPFVPTR